MLVSRVIRSHSANVRVSLRHEQRQRIGGSDAPSAAGYDSISALRLASHSPDSMDLTNGQCLDSCHP